MNAKVNEQKCKGCGECVPICPVDAIKMNAEVAIIDDALCVGCGACVSVCPFEAVSMDG